MACNTISTSFLDSSIGLGSAASTSWKWNFGDPGSGAANNSDTHENPSYTYSKSGYYNVKLVVASSGCKDSIQKEPRIFPMPISSFSVKNSCVGTPVYISNTSVDSSHKAKYQWSFGDNSSSTNAAPSHIYLVN